MEEDPWFYTWGDLEAIGLMVTPSQMRTVESGGRVVCLSFYPEPGSPYLYGQEMPAFDQHGEQIFVPTVVESFPTGSVAPVELNRRSGVTTLGDWLDSEVDNHWRRWPSYTGDAIDHMDRLWWMCDVPQVSRVWDGIPLVDLGDPGDGSERSVSHRLIMACERRIAESAHEAVDIIYGFEEMGELPDSDDEWTDLYKDRWEDPQDIRPMIMALEEDGYWDAHNNCFTDKPVQYRSMQELLAGDPEALGLWTNLVSQSRINTLLAQRSIPAPQRAYYNMTEGHFTPWS